MSIIEKALERQAVLDAAREPIDYARMARVWPKQKAALTRARKTGDVEKVAKVCKDAVLEWDIIGAWPDDWSRFERALNDMLPWHQHVELRNL